jgi:hypothetical protein
MFQISHEVPLCLLEDSRLFNDYDYALVHLFEKYPEYYSFYKNSLELGRRVILDNGVYELGFPFDRDSYAKYITQLKPTEYIIPDVRNNSKENFDELTKWVDKYTNLPGVSIGVVHGESYESFVENYNAIKPLVDKLAFSVEDFFFRSKFQGFSRAYIIKQLVDDNIIDKSKPHHILGALIPQEFSLYRQYKWIDSIDTSNPIIHGMLGILYSEEGLFSKTPIKMAEEMESSIDTIQYKNILYNIHYFRKFAHGLL